MDLETIGNYTGINYKWSAGSNVKTFMLDDKDGEERYNYVDIVPYYWLLNTDTVKAFSGAKTYAYNTYNDVSTWIRDFYSDGDLLPEFSYITQ